MFVLAESVGANYCLCYIRNLDEEHEDKPRENDATVRRLVGVFVRG